MSEQLSLPFRKQLEEFYQADLNASENLRKAVLDKVEATRRMGQVVDAAKHDLREEQFKTATDFLNNDAVKSYIKFAKSNPDPINDLEQALTAIQLTLRMTGTLPSPDGHGPQKLHESNFYSRAIRLSQTLMGEINRELKDHPFDDWRSDQLISIAAALEPISAFYDKCKMALA